MIGKYNPAANYHIFLQRERGGRAQSIRKFDLNSDARREVKNGGTESKRR